MLGKLLCRFHNSFTYFYVTNYFSLCQTFVYFSSIDKETDSIVEKIYHFLENISLPNQEHSCIRLWCYEVWHTEWHTQTWAGLLMLVWGGDFVSLWNLKRFGQNYTEIGVIDVTTHSLNCHNCISLTLFCFVTVICWVQSEWYPSKVLLKIVDTPPLLRCNLYTSAP